MKNKVELGFYWHNELLVPDVLVDVLTATKSNFKALQSTIDANLRLTAKHGKLILKNNAL